MNSVVAMVMGMCVLTAGCVGLPDEPLLDEEVDVPLEPLNGPIGGNGLNPVDFWAASTQSGLHSLGGGALLSGGALVTIALLDTAGGRSVLDYAVRCALPAGTSVTSAGGTTFWGSIGLAPAWTQRGLDTSEQRWVTACLLQHLNGLGAHVPMMLEGSHPALDPRPGEDTSDYTIKEATMFGNVFVDELIKGHACMDLGIQLTCGLDLSLDTLTRICGLSPTCGVTALGLCTLVCTDSASGDPSCQLPLLGPPYPEAIRARLRGVDLIALHPGCE